MSSRIFLHDHAEFRELIIIVSENLDINPVLVEKDYWIMHCLYGLNQINLKFELKGGTSLSKGFEIIDQFSEDIDIQIDPECAPFEVHMGKNHDKEKHINSRKDFYDWLVEKKLKIDGIIDINRDIDFDDEKYRNGGIRLNYNSLFSPLDGVKDGILLEVGFDNITPNDACNISSWAYEHAILKAVDVENNTAINIRCYAPEYTFVEKLQTISTKYRQQQEKNTNPTIFMRHYYDVARLLDLARVQNFISTEEYENYKKERFPSRDNTKINENEAFLLSDAKTYKLYQDAFSKSTNLYYKTQPTFEKIINKIKVHIDRL
jgi:predicted nucleotidyltransferase component of viral defense system